MFADIAVEIELFTECVLIITEVYAVSFGKVGCQMLEYRVVLRVAEDVYIVAVFAGVEYHFAVIPTVHTAVRYPAKLAAQKLILHTVV